jgi:hypothetical protein
MNSLLYKEFKLAINPAFYIMLLTPGLILIPNWLYFIAMSYLLWVVIPNIFSSMAANNDTFFSVLMPVGKRDVVKAKLGSIVLLELVNILIAIPFAIANYLLYNREQIFIDPNPAFFGFVLIMYALFNLIFITGYYKTAYKMTFPIIKAMIVTLLFAAAIEILPFIVPELRRIFDSRSPETAVWQFITLAAGVVIFVIFNLITFKISAERFEKLDL